MQNCTNMEVKVNSGICFDWGTGLYELKIPSNKNYLIL